MPRKKRIPLPSQGDAFAVPLADGRYSVCRVVFDATSEAARQWKCHIVLVVGSQWIGSEIPKADDPSLLPILHMNHHSWNQLNTVWVSEPVPDAFIPIGKIPPTASDLEIDGRTFGGWEMMALEPLAQWRWDNDRAAVFREDDEERRRRDEERKKAAAKLKNELARVTLEDLSSHKFFPRWKIYPPAKAIRASRDFMKTTVRSLIELGNDACEEDRMAILRSCIESFNELDAVWECIDTVVREDICEEFDKIVHACGLGKHANLADEWRDW